MKKSRVAGVYLGCQPKVIFPAPRGQYFFPSSRGSSKLLQHSGSAP